MPSRSKRPCNKPGCKELVSGGAYCEAHKRERWRQYNNYKRDKRTQRRYNARWRKARKMFLARHPLCVRCEGTTMATVVDHIVPHRGDYEKFWDESNWQPLCKSCHDRKTAIEDVAVGNARRRESEEEGEGGG